MTQNTNAGEILNVSAIRKIISSVGQNIQIECLRLRSPVFWRYGIIGVKVFLSLLSCQSRKQNQRMQKQWNRSLHQKCVCTDAVQKRKKIRKLQKRISSKYIITIGINKQWNFTPLWTSDRMTFIITIIVKWFSFITNQKKKYINKKKQITNLSRTVFVHSLLLRSQK